MDDHHTEGEEKGEKKGGPIYKGERERGGFKKGERDVGLTNELATIITAGEERDLFTVRGRRGGLSMRVKREEGGLPYHFFIHWRLLGESVERAIEGGGRG